MSLIKNLFMALFLSTDVVKHNPKKTVTGVVAAAGIAAAAMNPTVLDWNKHFEGFEPKVYIDAVGVPTIGYGHTRRAGTENFSNNAVWTEKYATRVLDKDMQKFAASVRRYITVPLTNCQLSVLTMFTYNVGPGNLKKSTLRRKLNAGNYDAVPSELAKWDFAGGKKLRGLTRRRMVEGKLWSTNCTYKVK